MDTTTESLIPADVHDFLVQFFSQNLTGTDWQKKIDNLQFQDLNDSLMVSIVRIIRSTLPQFIKVFSLGAHNPLLNIAAIETTHLNAFVHPCLDTAVWTCITNTEKFHPRTSLMATVPMALDS